MKFMLVTALLEKMVLVIAERGVGWGVRVSCLGAAEARDRCRKGRMRREERGRVPLHAV